jgi:hypothetical protein
VLAVDNFTPSHITFRNFRFSSSFSLQTSPENKFSRDKKSHIIPFGLLTTLAVLISALKDSVGDKHQQLSEGLNLMVSYAYSGPL